MSDALEELEIAACIPQPVHIADFNVHAEIPYGCTAKHMYLAMKEVSAQYFVPIVLLPLPPLPK